MDNIDIPIGTYDLAQVADLIGIYISDMLGHIVNLEQMGLYQDDRIIFILDSNGPSPQKYRRLLGHLNY